MNWNWNITKQYKICIQESPSAYLPHKYPIFEEQQ